MIGILQLVDVTVEFDGFRALDKLNFFVRNKELRFVIGPNGAGKTTFLDVICGKVSPKHGNVYFDDEVFLEKKPYQLSRMGIGRKFQTPSIFSELTVWQNIEISVPENQGFFNSMFHKMSAEYLEYSQEVLNMVSLWQHKNTQAGHLSHGQKQWLEIAMVMVQKPRVFLMDEPVAGMTKKERMRTGELLHTLIEQGCALIVVEHDMHFVKEYSKEISVLHAGTMLYEGTFEEVSSNSEVRKVYLGRD